MFITLSLKGIYVHYKIVLKKYIANDREYIDKDDSKDGCEYNWSSISSYGADNIEQCFFSIGNVKQLNHGKEKALRKDVLLLTDRVFETLKSFF